MGITQENARKLQTFRCESSTLTSGDFFVTTLLFSDGEIVVLEGETRRSGSPGDVSEAAIYEGYGCYRPLTVDDLKALTERYNDV